MDETKAIDLLKNWDEIISPIDCDQLLFWLSSWISEKEQDLTELDGIVAQARLVLIEQHGSVAKADAYQQVTESYKSVRRVENDLRRLKSARNNVRRRYDLLVNKLLQGTRRY